MLSSILSVSFLFFSLNTSAKKCEPKDVLDKACQFFTKHKQKPFIATKSGFRYRNPLYKNSSAPELQNSDLAGDEERLHEIFNKTKEKLIAFVLNEQNVSNLSPEKKSLLARLESVSFRSPEDQSKDVRIKCHMNPYNAFYVPETNSVTVCKGFHQYPTANLVFSLGHEIGHSMDPCMTTFDLYQITREYVEAREREQGLGRTQGWDQFFGDQDKIDLLALESNAFLFPKTKKTTLESEVRKLASAIPISKYPFTSEKTCLLKSEKFQERVPPGTDRKSCRYSQMNEALADVFGAYALSMHLNGEQVQEEDEAFGIFANADSELCDVEMRPRPLISGEADYPNTRRRFHSVVLKVPGIMESFGCELEGPSCFQRRFPQSIQVPKSQGKSVERKNAR